MRQTHLSRLLKYRIRFWRFSAKPDRNCTKVTLTDELLRAYGVPAIRQFITSSYELESKIRESINSGLPVVLISYDHQVIVDGYSDESGFGVHILNPDPNDNSDPWRHISGLNLTYPSMSVQEIITIPQSIEINTENYGVLRYEPGTRALRGSNVPNSNRLQQAIIAAAPYMSPDWILAFEDHGDFDEAVGLYAIILPSSEADESRQRMERLFRYYWFELEKTSGSNWFKILPVDGQGYLDIVNFEQRLRNFSLVYRAADPNSELPYFLLDEEDQQTLEANFARYFYMHIGFTRMQHYERILKSILSADNHLAYETSQTADVSYAAYEWVLSSLLGAETTHITYDVLNHLDNAKVYRNAVDFMKSHGQPVEYASHVLHVHSHAKEVTKHAKVMNAIGTGLLIADIGEGVVGKFLAASQPVHFMQETRAELQEVYDHLVSTGQNPVLANAMYDVMLQMDEQLSTFWAVYFDWFETGEVINDTFNVSIKVVTHVLLSKISHSHPVITIFYEAAHVGFIIGDALTNATEIDMMFRDAVVAKDIMVAIYESSYLDARNQIIASLQNSNAISGADIRLWDASAHLTYLSASYTWLTIANTFNVTTDFINWLWKPDDGQTYKEHAEQFLMPMAELGATHARTWVESPTLVAVQYNTDSMLWSRNIGSLLGKIASVDDVSPPNFLQQVDGYTSLSYVVDGTDGPFDIALKLDGISLLNETVDAGGYQHTWNSEPWHDGQERYLQLIVQDRLGKIVKDIVKVRVGETNNTAPTFEFLGPDNGETAFRYYHISWSEVV